MNFKMKPLDLDLETILEIIENSAIGDYRKAHEIEKYVKQRIKSACEFYLEWKDEPHMFCRAFPGYRDELREVLGNLWEKWWLTSISNNPPKAVWMIRLKYNGWLFRLAFGLRGDEKNG